MKAKDLIALLDRHRATLDRFEPEHEIGAFALIVGPEATVIEITTLGFETKTPFARYLIEQIQQRIDMPGRMPGDRQGPFVGVGR